jgi:hypothetical protein
MGFLDIILGSKKKNLNENIVTKFKKIGEIDKCPYCKNKLDKIPTRKFKCIFCGEYIYIRTRPFDRKKVLVTEVQIEEIEKQWNIYTDEKKIEERNIDLMKRPKYIYAKKELTSKFGKEPDMIDVIWEVYNIESTEFISKKQWSNLEQKSFRMGYLLHKYKDLENAFNFYLEGYYLAINLEEDYKDINIIPIMDLITKLKLSIEQVKDRFYSRNIRIKEITNMPLSEEKVWEYLIYEIEKKNIIEGLDITDFDKFSNYLKYLIINNEISNISRLLNRLEYSINNKELQLSKEQLKEILNEVLFLRNNRIQYIGEELLVFLTERKIFDMSEFKSILEKYVTYIEQNFEIYEMSRFIDNSRNSSIETKYNILYQTTKIIREYFPDILIRIIIKKSHWKAKINALAFVSSYCNYYPDFLSKSQIEFLKEVISILISMIKDLSNIKTNDSFEKKDIESDIYENPIELLREHYICILGNLKEKYPDYITDKQILDEIKKQKEDNDLK